MKSLVYLLFSASAHLLFLAEVTRHGARAPYKIYPFNERFWKESQLQQITELGLRQHFDLGRRLREIYPTWFERYSPDTFDVLSSPSSRAVLSAYAHIAGLYPDAPAWMQKFDGSGDPHTVHEVLPEFPDDSPIKIAQGDELYAVRGHDPLVCPRMAQIKVQTAASEEYTAQEAYWKSTLFPVLSKALGFPVTSISEVDSIGCTIACEAAAGRDPLKLSSDILDKIFEVRAFRMNHVPFSSTEAQSLASSGFFDRLTRQVEGALKGSGLKYAYYSTHDYTLLAYLNSLGALDRYSLDFAASLVFEVYEDSTVRVLLNQRLLRMDSSIETWRDLKAVMTKHAVDELAKACELRN
jgi:hypothetical protein